MVATKMLGYHYFWVDYICIDQMNLSTKMQQISIMNDIYCGAFATLVALDGTSANDGLPRVGKTFPFTPQMVVDMGRGNQLVAELPSLGHQLSSSTWARRGWTFQEGLLSQRRVFFTRHQVYFSCQFIERAESDVGPNLIH